MSDLETLRPEVREALERMIVLCSAANRTGKWMRADCDTVIIAELLRLARENDEWQIRCLQFQTERDKARAELAALKTRIQWQPISTAPTDGTCILVSDADGDVRHAHWDKPEWWCGYDCYGNDAFVEDPTMWMPLPPPPKGED